MKAPVTAPCTWRGEWHRLFSSPAECAHTCALCLVPLQEHGAVTGAFRTVRALLEGPHLLLRHPSVAPAAVPAAVGLLLAQVGRRVWQAVPAKLTP